MPCFFSTIDQDKLVGFALIYADKVDEAEISIIVSPEYRKKGIATNLMAEIKKVCANYRIKNLVYKTERIFCEEHPKWRGKYYIAHDSVSEYLLEWQYHNMEAPTNLINLELAANSEIAEIAAGLAEAFEADYEEELVAVKQILSDSSMRLFVFKSNHQILGTCAVELGKECLYLFSIAIFKGFRNKGYGKQALSLLLLELRQLSELPIHLQVEVDNVVAKSVYQSIGFNIISEIIQIIE